ncbi:hypothetical protein SNE40_021169 [Patella caerulea]|uniref:Uncharacterized protein n=1 Tax=Patella caerulea TaxID=87958 RepID=A0AAN8GAK8_PATCE
MASSKISEVSVGVTLPLGGTENGQPEILLRAGYLGLKRKMALKMTLREWSIVVGRFKRYLTSPKPKKFDINNDLQCELGTARQVVLLRKNGRQMVLPEKTFSELTAVTKVKKSFKRGRYQVFGCALGKAGIDASDWDLLKSSQTWYNTPDECISAAEKEGWD